jgi:quinate/shikimate dehydrogenase (NAD+)
MATGAAAAGRTRRGGAVRPGERGMTNAGNPAADTGTARAETAVLRLGLIGDNIAQSKAPLLHRLAGEIAGQKVTYDRLVPRELRLDFDATFARSEAGGYRGLNITYPYKEEAARRVAIDDPLVRAMGAVNTVIFTAEGPRGYNTDYSGFISAYGTVRGTDPAGKVCMIGAGGVGKAVAFGLLKVGIEALWIIDLDRAKAADLEARLKEAAPSLPVTLIDDPEDLPADIDGFINGTPVGMVGYEGTPLPQRYVTGASWVFDAIYTPLETRFLKEAAAAGLMVISGYELFFHQGVDAWQLFAGCPVDAAQLRLRLSQAGAGPQQG